ncbi:hypothetical protein C0J52_05127 [Blattella germanica]|nr:hypothetical protein C0J52_05127 [Blattella germanica]
MIHLIKRSPTACNQSKYNLRHIVLQSLLCQMNYMVLIEFAKQVAAVLNAGGWGSLTPQQKFGIMSQDIFCCILLNSAQT